MPQGLFVLVPIRQFSAESDFIYLKTLLHVVLFRKRNKRFFSVMKDILEQ